MFMRFLTCGFLTEPPQSRTHIHKENEHRHRIAVSRRECLRDRRVL